MKTPTTPNAAVECLVDALNRGDLASAAALYEDDAIFVAEPGAVVVGRAAIREALEGLLSLKPTLRTIKQHVLGTGEIAQYSAHWTMEGTGPDGSAIRQEAVSADVLRRQADGSWRIAIDNPYGAQLLNG